jgi:hypothetical protein
MPSEINRDKLLDHLQSIVGRLASNSFAIKGWAITLGAAFLGFSIKDAYPSIAWVGIVPIALFWYLDSYYLVEERQFRTKYQDAVSGEDDYRVLFDKMPSSPEDIFRASITPSVALIYLPLVAACIALGFGVFVIHRV